MSTAYKLFSPKSNSSRSPIDLFDAHLHSVEGAERVISLISSRGSVGKLSLGHNMLGNEGCIVLCKFLGSTIGRRYAISQINLNSNVIGDPGLLAISEFLKDDQHLKGLYIDNNNFSGDPSTISKFVNAINNSKLELLSLTGNRSSSDAFVEVFLPALDASYLRELHLSVMNLTPRSCPYILGYLTNLQRCRLHTIKCNNNNLGLQAVRSIVRAIAGRNYALVTVELYANRFTQLISDSHDDTQSSGQDSSGEDGDADEETVLYRAWRACQRRLNLVLTRNALLKRDVERESLQLLGYARVLLLRSQGRENLAMLSVEPLPAPPVRNNISSSFTSLPVEIQHRILSFLAPHLSAGQLIRIFGYGSSANTLPCLLPRLRAGGDNVCITDHWEAGFGSNGKPRPVNCFVRGQCGMQNIVLYNEEKRKNWLDMLRCSSYEPE